MLHFIRCVAEAIAETGLKGLAGLVPGGAFALAVAEGVLKKVRSKPDAVVRQDIEELAKASSETTKAAVEKTVREVLPTDIATKDDIHELEVYLTRLPEQVRQSLKRPEDPSGKTTPAAFALTTPADVMALLPRPPKFRPGAAVPGLDGWVLVRPLGVGGFGEVWYARHEQLEALHGAFKFCFGDSAQALVHEAGLIDRVMRAGDHANIVRLRNARLVGETPWLLFDYVGGEGAADWIHRIVRLKPEVRFVQGLNAIRQLANAVAFFHTLNPPIVHRDLKPSNILYDETTKQLRITDFGIGSVTAKEAIQADGTRGGRLLTSLHGSHTPLYASPQQRAGGQPDPRDDVHALGVIAYQLITGHLNQGAGPDFADDLRDAGAGEELITVLGKCVAHNPQRRPADATELKTLFAALAAKMPTRPLPSGTSPTTTSQAPIPQSLATNTIPPLSKEEAAPREPQTHLSLGSVVSVQASLPVIDPSDISDEYRSFLSAWADDDTATEWLEKRMERIDRWEEVARSGNPQAAMLTGACHEFGVGMSLDNSEAMRLYRLAADAGLTEGMFNVGILFNQGLGVERDAVLAVEWLRKAAISGNARGMAWLGQMYLDGNGVAADETEAMKWFRKAAAHGDTTGMCSIGHMFANGDGVTQDYGEAMKWFRKAADLGDISGMRETGTLYARGEGVEKDYIQAMYWLLKAADGEDNEAMRGIGYMYENGLGVSKDVDEAMKWFERAAGSGSAAAMSDLGHIFFEGRGRRKNYKKAIEWYLKAADADDDVACHQIGWMHQNAFGVPRNDEEALKWYRLGAERGFATSMYQLGYFHERGLGVPKDLALAVEWFEKADTAGEEQAAKSVRRLRRLLKKSITPSLTSPTVGTLEDIKEEGNSDDGDAPTE